MIDLRGITQTYQGSQGPVEALKGIDLTIQPGEVFGIIGKSGAGKSNWCGHQPAQPAHHGPGDHEPGQDLTQLNGRAQLRGARREIGMVFQRQPAVVAHCV